MFICRKYHELKLFKNLDSKEKINKTVFKSQTLEYILFVARF